MSSDTSEELSQQDQYLCTGCRYTFTLEWFGYRPDRPEGTRFTTCINCRNRGRGVQAKRKMPVGVPRLRASRGARRTTAPSGGTTTTTTSTSTTTTTGQERRVSGNQPTTRSPSVMPPPASPVEAHHNQAPKPPYPPQVVDICSFQDGHLQLPEGPLNGLCSEVVANPFSSLPLPDLEIFFGFQRHPTSVNARVAYFNPPYPPSLEIFLVMLQIRHDILEVEDISGVYLENESGQLRAFENIQGRAETWDVVMGILFKTAVSVKVYVEACYPIKTYCTCITRSID